MAVVSQLSHPLYLDERGYLREIARVRKLTTRLNARLMPCAPTSYRRKTPTAERPRAYHAPRPKDTEGWYRNGWEALAKRVRQEERICADCESEGRSVPIHEVDHIIRFEGLHDPLRLDRRNLVGRCRSHHAAKTYRDDAIRAEYERTGDVEAIVAKYRTGWRRAG